MKHKAPPALIMAAALLCASTVSARETVFSETFQSVNGQATGFGPASPSTFDNQGDWQLHNVYAGDHRIVLDAGGESTPQVPDKVFTLDVAAPGRLADLVLGIDAAHIYGLKINGKLNSADLAYIVSGKRLADLTYLDLSGVTLDYDNGTYYDVTSPIQPGLYSWTKYVLSETNYEEEVYYTDRTLTTYYSNNLGGLLREKESLTTVIWPQWLGSVGSGALSGCVGLTYFGAHDALTTVDKHAFSGCKALGNYKWIENVTAFGDGAFGGARVGYKMTFAKENTSFGRRAFYGTNIREARILHPQDTLPIELFKDSELERIEIGDGCKVLDQGSLYAANLAEVVLPSSIVDIMGACGVYGSTFDLSCPYIRNIPLEDGIRYINTIAYNAPDNTKDSYKVKAGTTKLSESLFAGHMANSIILPETLVTIGAECFSGARLKSIDLPQSLRYIGDNAFRYSALETLTIPENVEFIGSGIVQDCDRLWKVNYNAIDARGDHVLVWTNQGWNANRIERIEIGDKVKRIPSGVFTNNQNVTEVTLPASVEVIDTQAFFFCKALRSVYIPDNVSTIADMAFEYCEKLADIHWPLGLRTVGNEAFRECYLLKNISMPEGVTAVGDMAYLKCRSVERVYIPSTLTEIGSAAFDFSNEDAGTVITCALVTPPAYNWNSFYTYAKTVKVPAASLQAYWNSPNWSLFADVIRPIEDIQPTTEDTTTSFADIPQDTDFSDGYIGNVYITLGEGDSYDAADGCIVLGSVMSEEDADAVGNLTPGESDIANRFDGLVIMVDAGHGTVKVDCRTIGGNLINVKIGGDKPTAFAKDTKGYIEVEYRVDAATCIYIFGSAGDFPAPSSRSGENGSIRIYSVTVNPVRAGIGDISADSSVSPIESYYTVSGRKIARPDTPGVYIIRRQDGTSSKVLIK